jgi:D-inositol-3-phosphate glycosyltransferase
MRGRRIVAEQTPSLTAAPNGRIAVLSLHTSPTAALGQNANGGLNVCVRETCLAFSERGIATDVFTRRVEPNGHGEPLRVEELAALSRVIYLPIAPSGPLSKYELLDHAASFGDSVAAFAEREQLSYDLIHSHYWLSGVAAERLRERLGVPWVHTAHTLGLVKNRQLAEGAMPEPPQRIRAERAIAAQADRIVASTEDEAEDWVWLYAGRPERIRVVAPGVDLLAFRPQARAHAKRRLGYAGRPLVLFVGRLERLKGVDVLLRAVALLDRELRGELRVVIIGQDGSDADQSETARLRALVAELKLEDQIEFVGTVPHDRLPSYYSAADVCVMPSHSESFGLVALEAQACGCPVLAASVSGLQSVVRDEITGFLVPDHEPASYAARLHRLLGDPELSEQMGRRGTLLAQRFTWSRTADRLLEVYDELAETAQAGGVHLGARQE